MDNTSDTSATTASAAASADTPAAASADASQSVSASLTPGQELREGASELAHGEIRAGAAEIGKGLKDEATVVRTDLEQWFTEHFHNSPVSVHTEAFNHAQNAFEKLKQKLFGGA